MKFPEFLSVNGKNVKINVSLWKGQGKNIFAVHGLSSNSLVWLKIAEGLTPIHNFYGMDLRGRGKSEKPKKGYSIDIHCEDIKSVIDNLKIKPVIFMGHSLGAYIGIVFSAKYKEYVEKLILFDGGAKLTFEETVKIFESIKLSLSRLGKVYNSFNDYLSEIKKAVFLQPWQDYFEIYYKYEVEVFPNGKVKPLTPVYVIEEEAENLKKLDIEKYYDKIEVPVYVLRATEGMISKDDVLITENGKKKMLEKIKNIKFFDIKGTNHYSIVFHPNKERDELLLKLI